ncbi:MFS transporter, partial [Streptomyces sp. TRM76130]|nr:MFS transporter [Streptomyces sp. TRM76130]
LSAAADGFDAVFGVSACVAVLGVLVLVLFVPGRRRGTRAGVGAGQAGGTGTTGGAGRAEAGGTDGPGAAGGTDGPDRASRTGAADAPCVGGAGSPVRVREALALLRLPRLRGLAGCAALLGLTTVSDAFVYLLLQRRAGVGEEWFTLLPLGTAVVFLLLAVPMGA